LLLTFGMAWIAEGIMRGIFGVSGKSYPVPPSLQGGLNLGFMVLPIYRAWVVVASVTVCGVTWALIERTRLGRHAARSHRECPLGASFGINVPVLVTMTYGAGVALAALAGVLAAPVVQVSPLMGSSLVIVVFAVVVIGGMGSILGVHRQRPGARTRRGADQGRLSRSLEHRGVRHHGLGADMAAQRAVRPGVSMRLRQWPYVILLRWPWSRRSSACTRYFS
jgi:hypothetical protein